MDKYGNGSPTDRIANFEKIHGGAEVAIDDGTWVYYPDGALREVNYLGAMHEPDADPEKRCRRIVFYYELLLDRKVREFDTYKQMLLENPNSYPDQDANIARLKKLRGGVRRVTAKWRTAVAELEKHQPGYVSPEEREAHERTMAATRAAQEQYRAAIKAVTI